MGSTLDGDSSDNLIMVFKKQAFVVIILKFYVFSKVSVVTVI